MRVERARAVRLAALEGAGYNLDLISAELVARDFQTDSLMHGAFPRPRIDSALHLTDENLDHEIHTCFRAYFGFPHVVAVSQGRLAEAILSRALVRPGHVIPGSALFPTTRIHQEQNGATAVEVMIADALDTGCSYPFKGNIDVQALERTILAHGAQAIPYICIEPCNNAVGGHPVSMDNMRAVRAVADRYAIPVVLDATRIVENALLIQQRDAAHRDDTVWQIVLQFCAYADGCTMSATKDFPTPAGGFLAMRDPVVFLRCIDDFILFGSGLSNLDKAILLQAMRDPDAVLVQVQERMQAVKRLHHAISARYPLSMPVGGHALFIDARVLNCALPSQLHPHKAFLNQLYVQHGIRGAVNPQSLAQREHDIHLLRFAVPLFGKGAAAIDDVASDILAALDCAADLRGLHKVGQPDGLTGALRAQYMPVTEGIHESI